jgi:hypothetical protein
MNSSIFSLLLIVICALLSSLVYAQDFPPTPIAVNLPSPSQDARVRVSATNGGQGEAVLFKASARWIDPNIGQFGSRLNLTFVNVDLFPSRWQLRFHLSTNSTAIKEYWGSWTLVQLPNNWYQLLPHDDLRLDSASNVYFYFNGDYNSNNQVTAEELGINAAEIQIAPREGVEGPSVRALQAGTEFINVPLGSDVVNAPFADFIRSQKESKQPELMANSYKPPMPGPTSNWLGLYICEPIFALAIAFFAVATFGRWRYKQHFRQQSQERAWTKRSLSTGGGNGPSAVVSSPAAMETGDGKTEGGAVAEVYTYYTRDQRQSILQPGLAYRMSVYQAVNENESLRAGMKSPPLPELPQYGRWPLGDPLERMASPGLRSGTPQIPPPAMPLPRLPTPALQDHFPSTDAYNQDYDMGRHYQQPYDGRP